MRTAVGSKSVAATEESSPLEDFLDRIMEGGDISSMGLFFQWVLLRFPRIESVVLHIDWSASNGPLTAPSMYVEAASDNTADVAAAASTMGSTAL